MSDETTNEERIKNLRNKTEEYPLDKMMLFLGVYIVGSFFISRVYGHVVFERYFLLLLSLIPIGLYSAVYIMMHDIHAKELQLMLFEVSKLRKIVYSVISLTIVLPIYYVINSSELITTILIPIYIIIVVSFVITDLILQSQSVSELNE